MEAHLRHEQAKTSKSRIKRLRGMKKSKRRNPHIGGDALADVRRRVAGHPRLRARIEATVVRATIAVMVERARTQAGLTQAQLAVRAKTTQAVVARIEGGCGRNLAALTRHGVG